MTSELNNIWGSDPYIIKRYAEFITFTQGVNPDYATQNIPPQKYHKLYLMLRFPMYQVDEDGKYVPIVMKPLSQIRLFQDWLLIKDRDKIFQKMSEDSFNPFETVILEETPNPLPVFSEEKGSVKLIDSSTDHLTFEAEILSPSILLITDAYSEGWKAKGLKGSARKQYKVMPANYVLRAIALPEGHHLIRLEYIPQAFQIGKWISILSAIILTFLFIWDFKKK